MTTGNFVYDITDYDGTMVLLKKMRQDMEDTVKVYHETKGLPAKAAPHWTGDVRAHLETTMAEYETEARALQIVADNLSKAALDFIQERKNGDEEFIRKFKGIS